MHVVLHAAVEQVNGSHMAVVAGRQARFPAAWRLFTVFEPSRYRSRRLAQRLYLQVLDLTDLDHLADIADGVQRQLG